MDPMVLGVFLRFRVFENIQIGANEVRCRDGLRGIRRIGT